MKDAQSIRERFVDQLMVGDTIDGVILADILDQAELSFDLARIWKKPRGEQLEALDDLKANVEKIVRRFVDEHMDDAVRSELDADQCEREEFKRRMFA